MKSIVWSVVCCFLLQACFAGNSNTNEDNQVTQEQVDEKKVKKDSLELLQGIWLGERDVNQSIFYRIQNGMNVLDIGCIEGDCSLESDVELWIVESEMGFVESMDLSNQAKNKDLLKKNGPVLMKSYTSKETKGLTTNWEIDREFELEEGFYATTLGEEISDSQKSYVWAETIPEELYKSLQTLSKNGSVNFVKKYKLDDFIKEQSIIME